MSIRFQKKTVELFDAVNIILAEYDEPITLRHLFYRLVATGQIENTKAVMH